jgi:integrase
LKEPPAHNGFLPLKKFEELVANLPSYLHPLITLLYYCGPRLGEALHMEWWQADLKRHLILLDEGQTKNSEPRVLSLPNILLVLLEEIEPKTGSFRCYQSENGWARAGTAVRLGSIQKVKSVKLVKSPNHKTRKLLTGL